jgi:hypothetical protein
MKKLLCLGFLLILAACQPTAQTPTPMSTQLPTATMPPTPVPATDTPVPTPTLEPTATPFSRFFTDEFDAFSPSWTILQSGSDTVPSIKSENSTLTLQMDAAFTWAYSIYGAQDYQDIRVDARFANQAGSPASIGLVCRYSESEGWFEYNIMTDGTYNVLYGEWLAEGITDYLPILSGASNAIQPSGTLQEIALICSGTTLSLFIDQNLIRTVDVSRFELPGGKVGLTVSSFENTPVIAAFDWIRVSEP